MVASKWFDGTHACVIAGVNIEIAAIPFVLVVGGNLKKAARRLLKFQLDPFARW